jgi:hypothetical protein
MAAFSPPAGGGIDDVFPPWQKNSIRACPVTFPAAGGGGGATMAKQDAAPFRFSFDPPSDPALVDAFIKAYPNLPG